MYVDNTCVFVSFADKQIKATCVLMSGERWDEDPIPQKIATVFYPSEEGFDDFDIAWVSREAYEEYSDQIDEIEELVWEDIAEECGGEEGERDEEELIAAAGVPEEIVKNQENYLNKAREISAAFREQLKSDERFAFPGKEATLRFSLLPFMSKECDRHGYSLNTGYFQPILKVETTNYLTDKELHFNLDGSGFSISETVEAIAKFALEEIARIAQRNASKCVDDECDEDIEDELIDESF